MEKGNLYLVNAPLLPLQHQHQEGEMFFSAHFINVEEARELVKNGFVSAIGHQATADVLSLLLGLHIPMNRLQIYLEPGDRLIAFTLRQRLPEGKVITSVDELLNIGFDFLFIKRIR